ncbi:hypothetical protein MKK70_29695 [Methylobacterium sp. E-041]|jgi:hypothetical protein|uniref:hypothetical protein n=1 Tax=unclassified Methylobacterium TaxID=2615210 RepID=UPI001650B9B8|nr:MULTISPECIES: hypothetical protein [unclassified Methylobacterium]MCJ2008433.1 hypothetical protein [Methylobacterium sp. J-092]MCJ2041220.1 hypothetical protein [Methylobacterium sp. J-059]MCJ2075855.1 hypothetical protein [Methylobacterium sp. E-016]MCJ2109465.1 hypothetical protein [Methylobacterium sp. E-041]MCJ2113644.1 hypothetical protein [Methylobacterium sp. E-025]
MPRWLFLTFVAAVALAVLGSAIIVLRAPPSKPPAASLSCAPMPCPGTAPTA